MLTITRDRRRRQLLKQALCAPLAYSPMGMKLSNLAMTGISTSALGATAAAKAEGCQEARSLVCIFLSGGADSFNFIVPTDTRYADYRQTRNELAVAEDELLTASSTNSKGDYAFNQRLAAFHQLFEANKLAVISNVGPLLKPTTQIDYRNQSALPESLFAHDAQQKLWQTAAGRVSGAEGFGWGGAIAQSIGACNSGSGVDGAFSMNGSNHWQADREARYISLNPNAKVERMYGYDSTSATWIPELSRNNTASALNALLQHASISDQPLFVQEASGVIQRAKTATEQLDKALSDFPLSQWQPDAKNPLETQLHMVTRLILARESLGLQKQLFFVRMGGWDTHSNQNERLPLLMDELNRAITPYQAALEEHGVTNSVTSFTASDFGRTLTSNGNGTDHGWGGHNVVFGGAVNGGKLFGELPRYSSTDNSDDAGEQDFFAGRIIPSLSVNQYGATLARWMGVDEAELLNIFPDLQHFDKHDLGFML